MPAQDAIKERYRAVRVTALDLYGTFNAGELMDTDQVPDQVLKDLAKAGVIEHVDTLKYDEAGDNGRGAWVAQEPEVAEEAPAAKTETPPPAAKAEPAAAASSSTATGGKA